MSGQLNQIFDTLKECKSLPIEIIVVCDDHKDGTKDKLASLIGDEFPEIKLMIGEFNSPGLARNVGLSEATSPWIVFWDADDSPKPHASLQAIAEIQNSTTNLICTQYSIYDASTKNEIYSSELRTSEVKNLQAVGTQPGLWRFIFSRDLLSNLKFTPSKMGEDQEFLAQVFNRNPHVVFEDLHSYNYLVSRKGQLTEDKSNISYLIDTIEKIKGLNSKTPAKFKECVRLMLIQMILALLLSKNRKFKIIGFQYALRNLFSLVRSVTTILREKKERNG